MIFIKSFVFQASFYNENILEQRNYSQRSRLCAGWGIAFRLLVNVSQIYREKLMFYSFAQYRSVELELKLNSSTNVDGEVRLAQLAQNLLLPAGVF